MAPNRRVIVLVVVLVASLSTLTAWAAGPPEIVDGRQLYASLRQLVAADSAIPPVSSRALLAGMSDLELLAVVHDGALVNDTAILTNLVSFEFVRRLRTGSMRAQTILDCLTEAIDLGDFERTYYFWLLHSSVAGFTPDELRAVYASAQSSVQQKGLISPDQRLQALEAANMAVAEIFVRSAADNSLVESHAQELIRLATSPAEDHLIRATAVSGLEQIAYRGAAPALLRLAQDSTILASKPLARRVCLSLARLGEKNATPYIGRIMARTADEDVFGSAAVSLASLGGPEALRILLDNARRFDAGYVGASVELLDTLVIDMLLQRDSLQLPYAIRATQFLHKDEQIARFKPALTAILYTTNNKAHIRLILDRLQQLVTPMEAKEIVRNVPFDTAYSSEWLWLKGFSEAKPASSSATTVSTPGGGRLNPWEYGDPGYQQNSIPLYNYAGHTGLFCGIDGPGLARILEVSKLGGGDGLVHHNYWSDMVYNTFFWGTRTTSNRVLSAQDRRNVINTAWRLAGRSLSYGYFDALHYSPNPGTVVDWSEVTALRCDGLVEYSYEFNNIWVWGKNSLNYDISLTANVAEHNNFYDNIWPNNTCTELAPVVQCGRYNAQGTCTYMTATATGAVPTYSNVRAERSGATVNVWITATDVSGIHYIEASNDGGASWKRSPVEPEQTTSASSTWNATFNMPGEGTVYYYAMDNAGSYPATANGIVVPAAQPDLVPQSLSVTPSSVCGGGAATASFTVRNQGVGYADASRTNIRINTSSTGVTTSDPLLASVITPALTPGATTPHSVPVTIPPGRPIGTNYIWVILDVDVPGLNQSDETNDYAHVAITINPVPGTVSVTGLPGSVCGGQTYSLSAGASGATGWSWSSSCGGSFSSPSSSTTNWTAPAGSTGPCTITATASNGCGSTSGNAPTTISVPLGTPSPVNASVDRQGEICVNWNWTGSPVVGFKVYRDDSPTPVVRGTDPAQRKYCDEIMGEHFYFVRAYLAQDGTDKDGPPSTTARGYGHTVGIQDGDPSNIPTSHTLSQNYPNPFNSGTEIRFALPTSGYVTLTVFDVLGREVTRLVDQDLGPGVESVSWDGTDAGGRSVPSGVYFYRLTTGSFSENKKMVLLK